ncbi:MAG: hypothetical protein ACOVN5_06940 [Aquidulcibacter sp.]
MLETRTDRDQRALNIYRTVFRRRECLSCKHRFNSAEVYEERLMDFDQEQRAKEAERKLQVVKTELAKLSRLI